MQQPSKYNKKRNRLADIEDKLVITSGEREVGSGEGQDWGRRLRCTKYYV